MNGRGERAPLGREYLAAAQAVAAVQGGQRLPDAVDAAAREHRLHGPSRAAIQHFAFDAVRYLGWSRAVAAQLNRRPPAPPLLALQLVVLAQWAPFRSSPLAATPGLAPTDAEDPGATAAPEGPHRADAIIVDQAVHAARQLGGQPAASFLNATLRRFLREREALDARALAQSEARFNLPDWWLERLRADHPAHWQAVAEAANRQAPLILRVNRRRSSVDAMRAALREAGWPAEAIEGDAIRLPRSTDVSRLPGFEAGWCSVQDYGAQLAARWLDVAPGHRVLDACAAPGGKTAHLLELADVRVLALDVDAERLRRVHDNLRRLGFDGESTPSARADLLAADALRPDGWWDGEHFDRILLDAPCSASGIVGRHPDIRWLRRRRDLATLSGIQRQMLDALWPLLKPGGKLLYAVCSVFRAEGENVVRAFLAATPRAVARPLGGDPAGGAAPPAPAGSPGSVQQEGADLGRILLPGVPIVPDAAAEPVRDHDGFYYCLLQKTA